MHYEDMYIRFNGSVTRGWVGVEFPEKKRYVTLEWPHSKQPILRAIQVLRNADGGG